MANRVYKTRAMEPARETGRVLQPLGEALIDVPQTKFKKNIKRKPGHNKSTYKRRDMQAEEP